MHTPVQQTDSMRQSITNANCVLYCSERAWGFKIFFYIVSLMPCGQKIILWNISAMQGMVGGMGETFVEQKIFQFTVVTNVGQPAKAGYNLSKILL